jgi:hypothetical protein
MAVMSVAQTWYSSLRSGKITPWQKLKDMLVTSFQGFQTKPVIAQALFQCTQDHEEYLQAYVRRFLQLRAQAPAVPNEIVIEAMIKGLRPGPTTQYFARKPPQTLEKLLQKMDEYIRADNDFRQRREEAYRYSEMTRGFRGRLHPRHVRTIHNPNTNDDRANHTQSSQQRSQSSGMQQTSYRPPALRDRGGGALEEGLVLNPGDCSAYSVGGIRDTPQGCAKSQSKSRRRLLKLKHGRTIEAGLHIASCYSPYISEYVGSQQPTASVASASHSQASWAQFPPPPPLVPTLVHNQQQERHCQAQQQHDTREESEARTVNNTVPKSRHIY